MSIHESTIDIHHFIILEAYKIRKDSHLPPYDPHKISIYIWM